ncbi:MAG: hypothetical protein KDD61_17435 [Bdellovibrionales bacterium]|nr:hypothetical protein [Bdellovibrionales bacterium]
MKRFPPILFFITVVLTVQWLVETTSVPVASTTRSFSQNRTPSGFSLSQCVAALKKRPQFSYTKFKQSLREFSETHETLKENLIETATRSPERFLALMETLSQRNSPRAFNFTNFLLNLSESKQKALYKEIHKVIRSGKITEFHLRNLLVKVYRLVHEPQGFWKSLWSTKSLRLAFEKIDDQKIMERLDLELFREGLDGALKVITKDPTWTVKVRQFLYEHSRWFDNSLAAVLWGLGITFAPEMSYNGTAASLLPLIFYFPPYIPGVRQWFQEVLTPETKKILLDQGGEKFLSSIQMKLLDQEGRIHRQQFFRKSYSTLFTVVLAFSISLEVIPRIQLTLAQEYFRARAESIEHYISDRSTPEELGIQRFEVMIKKMEEERGEKVDRNDPEIIEARRWYIEMATIEKETQRPTQEKPKGQ